MFTEREALKLRLEQLADQEERFFKLFREERNIIFRRLSEIDQVDVKTTEISSPSNQVNELLSAPVSQAEEALPSSSKVDKESLATLLDQVSKTFANKAPAQPREDATPQPTQKKQTKPASTGNKRGRKPIVTPEKEAAINFLKQNPKGMKGADLQRAVEEATGSPIANMTTFMKSVENLDPNVQKPRRGMYKYRA